MLSRKLKNSQLVFILPLIGLVTGFVLLVLLPGFREIKKTRDLIQLKTDFIAKTETLRGDIQQTEKDHTLTAKFCEEWGQQSPTESDISRIHQEINDRAAFSGVTVTGFDPLETVRMKSLLRIPVLLKASGSYAQIHAMLANLESLPSSLWLEDVKLRSAGKNTDIMNCEVTLVVFGKNSEELN